MESERWGPLSPLEDTSETAPLATAPRNTGLGCPASVKTAGASQPLVFAPDVSTQNAAAAQLVASVCVASKDIQRLNTGSVDFTASPESSRGRPQGTGNEIIVGETNQKESTTDPLPGLFPLATWELLSGAGTNNTGSSRKCLIGFSKQFSFIHHGYS